VLARLGSACLSVASIVRMRVAFFPDSPTASLTLGIAFFALGALVTPVLVDVLSGAGNFSRAAIVLALVCLLPALFAAVTGGQHFEVKHNSAESPALASSQAVWLAGLVFFFYAPLEAS